MPAELFLGALLILLVIGVLALVVFLFVAWIMMIVDCIKRDFNDGSERIAWILVLIFLSLIGLIIYYFVVYRKGKKKKR